MTTYNYSHYKYHCLINNVLILRASNIIRFDHIPSVSVNRKAMTILLISIYL